MSSPQTTTEYFDHGLVRVAITRHGTEDSKDYSATISVASRCIPHAPGRFDAMHSVRGVLAQLTSDALAAALATEMEETPHE